MPEPVAEPALNGLRLNLRIVSVVIFNFASYLTIGLPLAVLPGYVHDVMGFSAFWAGLVISLQYFATLLSRPRAGRYADLLGPKKIVVFGLCGCFLSGLSYLLAALEQQLATAESAAVMPWTSDPRHWPELCRHGVDAMGRRRCRLAAYRAGDFVERHCDLRRDGDGRAAGRACAIHTLASAAWRWSLWRLLWWLSFARYRERR